MQAQAQELAPWLARLSKGVKKAVNCGFTCKTIPLIVCKAGVHPFTLRQRVQVDCIAEPRPGVFMMKVFPEPPPNGSLHVAVPEQGKLLMAVFCPGFEPGRKTAIRSECNFSFIYWSILPDHLKNTTSKSHRFQVRL